MSAPTSPDRVAPSPAPSRTATARGRRTRPERGPDRTGPRPARVVVLARVALVPPVAAYGVAVVLAGVVTALASGIGADPSPDLSRALAVGVPLWLAAHLVPLQLGGVPLGVLPLAPALALAVLVARVARTAAERLGSGPTTAGAPVVATAVAAHAVVGVLAAALLTPETVVDASPGVAGVVAGVLAGVAALTGVARPCGALAELRRLPDWARQGLRSGLLAVGLLLCAGATLLLAALLADAPAVAAILTATAPEAGSGAGLTLLSALYLPNAVVAATSWLVGPGLTLGLAAASPTAAVPLPPGGRPPIPVLALLPDGPPPSWAALAFAVPLAVGSVVGWWLASDPDPYRRLRAVLVAATVAAAALGALAALSGGRAGAGPIDPVVVPAAALAAAVLAWVLVPGATVAILATPAVPGGGSRGGRGSRDDRAARRGSRSGRSRGDGVDGRARRGREQDEGRSGADGAHRGSPDEDADGDVRGLVEEVGDGPDEGERDGAGDGGGDAATAASTEVGPRRGPDPD